MMFCKYFFLLTFILILIGLIFEFFIIIFLNIQCIAFGIFKCCRNLFKAKLFRENCMYNFSDHTVFFALGQNTQNNETVNG